MDPKVLILDEPAAGLDPRGREEILCGISEFRKEHNSTVIIVSHSMEDMALYSDELVVMSHGEVLVSGTVEEVFKKSDLIASSGLSLPQITRVFDRLRRDGALFEDGIYTVEHAKEQILALLKGSTNA